MDARRFLDARGLANITLKELIDWYSEEIGSAHPFGKNKEAVLFTWMRDHGEVSRDKLTADYLTMYVRYHRKAGASGVTISIDLTYLDSLLRSARGLRKLPLNLEVISSARANMTHLKISTKSKERSRRSTIKEIDDLCN